MPSSTFRRACLVQAVCAWAASDGTGVRAQQFAWQAEPSYIEGGTPALAYDALRHRLVMAIGDATWSCDGAVWRLVSQPHAPGWLGSQALAFDSVRGTTLQFGGFGSSGFQNNLWSFDGATWTPIITAQTQRPSPRAFPSMAFDAARARLVLFGGQTAGPSWPSDTWEFDGSNWLQQFPANVPTARMGHQLVFDEARGTTLLFGGLPLAGQPLADTWQWDGSNWLPLLPVQSPTPRFGHGMVWDSARARIVLFGGRTGPGLFADTWQWDGANWSAIATTVAPPASADGGLAFDSARGEVVHVDNWTDGARVWAFDGTAWRIVLANEGHAHWSAHAMAYDPMRECTVTFGGLFGFTPIDQTWEHRGGYWLRIVPTTSPPARHQAALAFDPLAQLVLLFGGKAIAATDDTWHCTDSNWQVLQPLHRPSARWGHALATDTARGRVVLFGGQATTSSPGGWLGDTWEWNGSDWLQQAPAQSPPSRSHHAMAYDPLRGRTVLYGGGDLSVSPSLSDHWQWDGTNWTQHTTATSPGPRAEHGMAFDPATGTVVLFGGYDVPLPASPTPLNDTWDWNGASWQQRLATNPPPLRNQSPIVYEAALRRLMLHGVSNFKVDTWLLGPVSTGSVTAHGTACAGSIGLPQLRARGVPLQGNRWFALQASSMPAGALVVLGLSVLPTSVALPGGCTALVDQAQLAWRIADARGSSVFDLPIPNVPAIRGVALFSQALALDSGGAFAGLLSLSAALRIQID